MFQFMKKVKRVKLKTIKHADSFVVAAVLLPGDSPTRELIQHCVHCQCDARELWNPPNDHIYNDCFRRREVQHGSYYVKQLHLLSNGISYPVCTQYFKKTFGLGCTVFNKLYKHCGCSILPKEICTSAGSKKSTREQLVRQYIATVPRHYSHYSPTSTSEYVQCASSCLNWWKGPLESDLNGVRPLCLLEWLDSINETNSHELYTNHGYFPGVHVVSEARPSTIDTSTTSLPVPAVSYHYFLSVVNKCDIQFKDLSPDQCAKCMQCMSNIQNAKPDDVVALREAWTQHKKQADVGYLYRAARKNDSKQMWRSIVLTEPVPPTFPPPAPPITIWRYSDKHDFTECDMGGGRRTPLIKQGPQYYLRTLPSKPYYICSTVRGDVAYWWNEQIGEFGADSICSVNYLYDTCMATGAGARTYWVDGTAAQSWNKLMFTYCLDCCNPESPTFSPDPTVSLYKRVDMYRNPPGHTFMRPDATHGQVSKYGKSLAYVATTEEWATRVTKNCRGSSMPITSTIMQQNMFRNWNTYLAQMYRASILSSTDNESFIILHYYWANFGWGKRHTDGMLVSHPHEVWLYTCKGAIKDEWYLEAPIKICLPRNFKSDGSLPKDARTLVEWMGIHSRAYVPIADPEFQMYSEPLPLELAKQRDLRTLSKYLPPPITQEQIDEWYPEPTAQIGDLEDDDSDGSISDSNC